MSIDARLKKLEATIPPCAACEMQAAADSDWWAYLIERGVEVQPPEISELIKHRCPYCGVISEFWFPGYTAAERSAEMRLNAAEVESIETGAEPSTEIVDLCKWLLQRRREIGTSLYGPMFKDAIEASGYGQWERDFLEAWA